MSHTLTEIAQTLIENDKKVQLIYAFNGTGKTRLSREIKDLVAPKNVENPDDYIKVLYYNAFTEDLFYWDNDLDTDTDRKLLIRPNNFTDWIIRDRGQDQNIIGHFQRYTIDKITPLFIEKIRVVHVDGVARNQSYYPEVTFTFNNGEGILNYVKISKAEERCFVWSIFYSFFKEIVDILKYREEEREEPTFDGLKYIIIDDPVSSLDDNHLIELAVDVAKLVKSCESQDLKFIITTHNPLFYNVISNELNNKYPNKNPHIINEDGSQKEWIYKENQSCRYKLDKMQDGRYNLIPLGRGTPFSYHISLLAELQNVRESNQVKKYHFSFLRNILEKTSTFLGYSNWEKLLPKVNGEPDPFANRILNLSSHSAHAGEEIAEVQQNDKEKFIEIIEFFKTEYKFSNLIATDAEV